MTTRPERMDSQRLAGVAPAPSISVAQATLMLDDVLAGRRVESVELMSGGVANRNVYVRLDRRPFECVLRLYDRDPAACAREVAVLGLLGRDVPVPRVLYMQDEPDFGPPYSVLSVVQGISLDTLRMLGDDDALAEAMVDAGRVLARLRHFPGPRNETTSITELVERRLTAAIAAERVPVEVRRAIIELLARWEPRLHAATGPSLVHGDFTSKNIFVKQTDQGWRVSGVLDWECAVNGSPFTDVGRMLRLRRDDEAAFSQGLVAGGMTLPPDWRMLASLADLPAIAQVVSQPDLFRDTLSDMLKLLNEMLRDG